MTRWPSFRPATFSRIFSTYFVANRTMATHSYAEALERLNSLQSNYAAVEAAKASGGRMVKYAQREMNEYLHRIGYSPQDLNALNVIHVTGTKGKGSTCAFVDSIIRKTAPEWKVGLFTSPHLVAVNERIRINGTPIPEEDFVRYFFEVWDRLEANTKTELPETPPKPMYFKYLTLVAYHAFLSLKVDAAILEVGVGGEYDSTNIVPKPLVTGIASLGLDHTSILGKTLPEIAWQKSGIYKEGVPAFTVEQPADPLDTIRKRAEEKKASSLTVVKSNPALRGIKLGLAGSHQYQNASLAVALAQSFFEQKPPPTTIESQPDEIPDTFVEGLKAARCPGRCQTVLDPDDRQSVWYLDGAHTIESLHCCAEWFVTPGLGLKSDALRILIFNCTKGRSSYTLLGTLLSTVESRRRSFAEEYDMSGHFFDHVIFCTNITYADGTFKGDFTQKALNEEDIANLKTQGELAEIWTQSIPDYPKANIHKVLSIEHAIKLVRDIRQTNNKPVDTLVTGSLLLVGGVIEVAGLRKGALGV